MIGKVSHPAPRDWLRGKTSGRACGCPESLHVRSPTRLVAREAEEGTHMIQSEFLVLIILYVLLACIMVALTVH
jgi:hypothetical protein